MNSSLNSLYYFFSYSKWSLESMMKRTVNLTLNIIPEELKSKKVFLIIDDTLQEKFGNKFAGHNSFFDHVRRNNSSYLKGNTFVCLAISIPVSQSEDGIEYKTIPIGFRLYKKDKSKLTIAKELIDNIMRLLNNKNVTLLCDSWYTKGDVLDCVKDHDNLELIGAVRHDTAIFELPPPPNGKRGRNPIYGKKLNITELDYEKNGDYYLATKLVRTRLFRDKTIEIMVTVKDIDDFKNPRVFINTNPKECELEKLSKPKVSKKDEDSFATGSFTDYEIRWSIEVIFYELKTFWSFGNYMVRTEQGIETYINLLGLVYTFAKILPFWVEEFDELNSLSPQEIKSQLALYIREELILDSFVSKLESTKIYSVLKNSLNYFIDKRNAA
ncbi:transposase [Natroniella acetigena]|nr:transposase [Natroniella acetigena]MCK8827400.1 transposase [Natroniella acetigena]